MSIRTTTKLVRGAMFLGLWVGIAAVAVGLHWLGRKILGIGE
jgi:hypothetical protein